MTNIEKKALALVNAEIDRDPTSNGSPEYAALCRAIEQHEAFRQEVSDAISELSSEYTSMGSYYADKLEPFIIAKPDPLAEAWIEATGNTVGMGPLNEAIAKRGGKIVWEND